MLTRDVVGLVLVWVWLLYVAVTTIMPNRISSLVSRMQWYLNEA